MNEHLQVALATGVFLITYALIVSEKVHRAVAAFCGAAVVVLAGILTPEGAVEAVDWNTVGLLVGMMIIVGVTRETGVFEYLAIKAAKAAKGRPLAILASLAAVTALLSAFLDNVTTVLLIVPVTFAIARKLNVSPLPFLVTEILASNIGGTATLIGDPPNIMIGSATHLGFLDFVINLTPVIVLIHVTTIFILQLLFRRRLQVPDAVREQIFELDETAELKDLVLLRRCLAVIGLVIAGFLLHQALHLESSVVALTGASLLLLVTRAEPEHPLQQVEWPVIFFFIGLFVVVGALEEVGVIEALARFTVDFTGGVIVPTGMLILWISALASAFVDNIPFVATMIPLLKGVGQLGGLGNYDMNFLWWCLSLGACLGGNGTIIGASANVVVVGMAEKRGLPITFLGFMKVAFPLMLLSIAISTAYMYLWYVFPTGPVLALVLGVAVAAGAVMWVLSRPLVTAGEARGALDRAAGEEGMPPCPKA
ncbi:MAG: ArsB/NhaD family transporter [Thermoanaerobacterales bacterium]|nr:ArsB/NhaD family transporter [Bacillota bacterium]MDI6906701.1 ArsB/NhaD family transporter [Thermoanaerobacterales bacterium]